MAKQLTGRTVTSDENQALTSWLKDKRKEKGHTMRSLATLLGTSHSFIGKIEKMERRLDAVELVRYCNALGVDPVEGISKIQDLYN